MTPLIVGVVKQSSMSTFSPAAESLQSIDAKWRVHVHLRRCSSQGRVGPGPSCHHDTGAANDGCVKLHGQWTTGDVRQVIKKARHGRNVPNAANPANKRRGTDISFPQLLFGPVSHNPPPLVTVVVRKRKTVDIHSAEKFGGVSLSIARKGTFTYTFGVV